MSADFSAMRMRHRRAWEAPDLGVSMARLWFLPLIVIWLSLSFPILVALFFVFWQSPEWIAVIMWWLKPLWERALLFYLSRAIFDDAPGILETIKHWPKTILPQWLPSLTWRRLSATRSMDLPALQLEGLKGTNRRDRLRILHDRGGNVASWTTVIYFHVEGVIGISILVIVGMLIPSEIDFSLVDYLSEDSGTVLQYVLAATGFIAMSLVAPFYIASGFSLYLNRRVELEAWDIDLAFRRIVERRKGGMSTAAVLPSLLVATLVALSVGGSTFAPASFANEERDNWDLSSREQIREQIDTVLANKRVGKEDTIRVPKIEKEEDKDNFDLSFFSFLGKIFGALAEGLRWLLYIALAVFIVLLITRLPRWIETARVGIRASRSVRAPPTELFGLDVRPESLPEDIGAAVVALWQSNPRAALALFYRAALAKLIYQYHLDIPAGATEGDCVLLTGSLDNPVVTTVVSDITQCWKIVAYGHRLPEQEHVFSLAQQWNEIFAEPSTGTPTSEQEPKTR